MNGRDASRAGENTRRDAAWLAGIAIAAVAILSLGWSFFWFLCDDAYIAFRYVSNSQRGLGYVWNAPPFLPVEGYTSLLWLWLLDGVWSATGVPPPESASTTTGRSPPLTRHQFRSATVESCIGAALHSRVGYR